MIVQHNMQAMNSNRILGVNTAAQAKSTEKLSSGYRINRAADDAAGLAISEKMRGQIRGLGRASDNAQDGISLIQVAEGALNESHSILQRMRELAVQAANDTATDDDRTQIQNEIDQLTQEVDRIANTTEFNTKKLLDGSRTGAVNEKAGKIKAEGSFGNSMVTASVTTDGSAKAGFSDVIRLEITKDFEAGQSTTGTTKLSDEMIDNINKLLTTGGSIELPLNDANGIKQTIQNDGWNTNNSKAENLEGAIESTKDDLATAKTTASNSAAAVEFNENTIAKTVDNIMKLAKDNAEIDGTTFLKKGVTEEDLTKAIKNYVAALVEDGKTGGGTSDAITAANKELSDLFDTASSETLDKAIAVGTLAGTTPETIATGETVATIKNAANTMQDATLANNATKDYATTATLGTVATDTLTQLVTNVKAMADVEIANNANQAKVDKLTEVLNVLEDTDLSNAIVDYKEAVKTYDNTVTAGGASEDKLAELQAKVDETKANLDKLNTESSPLNVTDLFGNSDIAGNFEIASAVDENNNLTINLKNKEGEDTVITIENADKLKAGDTLVITSEEMVESKEAAVGKDALRLQIGANAGQEMSLGINSMRAEDLDIVQVKDGVAGKALDVTSQSGAAMAIEAYDMAIQKVSTERAKMGAVQNRLEHTIANLDTAAENTQNSESRIRDVDMASEMVTYSKNNILQQAAQSMLAQANQSTQGVLSLLQ